MDVPYPIVKVRKDWDFAPESMGSKKKIWYRPAGDGARWLFKYPQDNTGEHWAEKIADAVADLLQIPHPRVKLAVYDGSRGSATESFADGELELVHGNQILADMEPGYDPNAKRFTQSEHTLENVWRALDRTFIISEDAEDAKRQFAGYVILDALIGNTDRHHENWGIVRWWTQEGSVGFLAPSFDHASSLGRELLDENRSRRLAENSVGHYAERGRGGIYWTRGAKRAPSPPKLVRLATKRYPHLFRPALEQLNYLSESSLSQIISRVPDDWMSEPARMFALALMRYNLESLKEVAQC